MGELYDFILNLIAQFAGGPGAPENNLVRFGLAAVMWGVLLVIAWNRQRTEHRPRERLLVVGFALALFRELFMLGHLSMQMLGDTEHNALCSVVVPVEHALTLASVVLIAGSFLRYILDSPRLARRYLTLGLGATIIITSIALITWPQEMAADPSIHFHETDVAWLIHLIGSLLLVAAIVILVKEHGWLRNIVILALGFFLISESLVLVNFLTDRAYNQIICPLGNSFYIWAIPLFGLVYLREQGAEKRRAEEALQAYRDQLEELVEERTTELSKANQQLQVEIKERSQIEAQIAQRNAELAAQIAISDAISQSLDLNSILHSALRGTMSVLSMDSGCIILFDRDTERVQQRIWVESGRSGRYLTVVDQENSCEVLARQVAHDRTPKLIKSADEQNQQAALFSPEGGYSLQVSTPLVAHGRGIGALTLASMELSDMSARELDLLRAIGLQIGVAVENARLHQKLKWAAALEERQRIAADMHDGLIQTLNYLSFTTDQAHEMLATGRVDEVLAGFDQMQAIIDQANQDVRVSIASLQKSPAPRRSVQELLAQVAEHQTQDGEPRIIVESELEEPLYLPAADLEEIAKVLQEALVNAKRHGRAQEVQLGLSDQAGRYQLAIVDDGNGFDLAQLQHQDGNHFGLAIMKARAARLKGELAIDSRPSAGTTVTLTWLKPRPDQLQTAPVERGISTP